MKVVHLSTYDLVGGAARAMRRLHRGLGEIGVESSLFVLRARSSGADVRVFAPQPGLLNRLRRKVRRMIIRKKFEAYVATRPPGYEEFSGAESEFGDEVIDQLPQADVLHLHWISGFIDLPTFLPIVTARGIPVVWTLHDMNAMTGGCHYTDECQRFHNQCGCCPQLGSTRTDDYSRATWRNKDQAFRSFVQSRMQLVVASRWMETEVKRSSLLSPFPVSVAPFGLDTSDFCPRDRKFAREILRIPPDAKVVLFAADQVTKKRKGFGHLAKALGLLTEFPNLLLLSLGAGEPEVPAGIRHVHLGFGADDRWLSLVYSAADVFIIPSTQEAFGQTALEAMACGTPVIGFNIGGIPDIVRPKETGLLCEPFESESLAAAVIRLLKDDALRESMSASSRRIVLNEYTLEKGARHYESIYQRLVRPKGS